MEDRVRQLLDGYPVAVPIVVAWADMDVFRHVNNTVYFRYFEIARIEYLRLIGLTDARRDDGIGPILHSTGARFRLPLRFPDTAWTGARVLEVLDDRFTMEYLVVSEAAGAVSAEGTATVVAYDYGSRRKASIPTDIRQAIEEAASRGA